MAEFQVPAHVRESIEARERAAEARRNRACVYDDCDQPAARARGGRAARCLEHDLEEFGEPVVPDPTRTLTGLRAAAGLRAEAFHIGRTSFDVKAEAKGQRVSAENRRKARGEAVA